MDGELYSVGGKTFRIRAKLTRSGQSYQSNYVEVRSGGTGLTIHTGPKAETAEEAIAECKRLLDTLHGKAKP
jgi:hypothetical protein